MWLRRVEALRIVLSTREPAKIRWSFVEYHGARMILKLYDEVGPEARRELAEAHRLTPTLPHVKLIASGDGVRPRNRPPSVG
jgi:hypothetical protein